MALAAPPTGGVITLGAYTINLMDEMGRGTFGTVYKGTHTKTKAEVAVKKMQITNDKMGAEGLEEIKKFEKIEAHENIVRLHDFHYLDSSFWMIMEFCEAGDLDAYMKKNETDMETRFRFMSQSASALAHMHNQQTPVIHRDIKPGNILLKEEKGVLVVKLTDFGLSRMVSAEEMMKTAMFNTVVGTPGFMAPELYMRLPHNHAVDIFALGLVFLAMLTQKKGEALCPVSMGGMIMAIGQEMMMRHTMKQPMPDLFTEDASDPPKVKTVKQMIRRMTVFDPKDRINMKDVDSALKGLQGGGVAAASGGSVSGKMFSRKRLPTPPSDFEVSPDSSLRITASDDDDDDDGLGMVLLKQALDEHVKHQVDQLSTTARKEEQSLVKEASTMELFKRAYDADKFDEGDRVIVDEDMAKVKRLQKGHGGWNEKMKDYLGQEGEVASKRFTQVDVKFPDGRKWAFNPEIVRHAHEKAEVKPQMTRSVAERKDVSSKDFSPNDIVQIMSDTRRFEELQQSAGLWQDWLRRVCGLTGIVHKIDDDGDVVVEVITGEKVYVHGDALTHVDQSQLDVEAGDLVYVKNDVEEVKANQEGHGGWNPQMAEMVGHATTVKRVVGEKAILEDGGNRWAFNVRSLLVVAKNRDLMRAIMTKREAKGDGSVEIPCKVQ